MLPFRLLVAFLLAAATSVAAQTVPPRGDASTVDVAAWNVERFGYAGGGPSNDALQLSNVTAVIRQAEIDLWAMQEVNDPVEWNQLLANLSADGYTGVLGPSVSSGPEFDQRLAFVYDPAVVSLIQTRTILPSNSYDFGGRAPFELIANVTSGGTTRQVRFIALHAKAGGGQDDFQRRLAGSQALKAYTDAYVDQGIAFVVLGDYNDELTTSTASGQLSPYRNFGSDSRYEFATRALDQANTPTYCSNASCTSGSTLDHVLIPTTLSGQYVAGSGARYAELLSAISSYTSTTSDHLPVLARFNFAMTSGAEEPATAGPATLRPAAPSPFRRTTELGVSLSRPAQVRLDVVDVLGRTVALLLDGRLPAGDHTARFDGTALAPGLYLVRLSADGQTAVQTLVRTR